MNAKTKNIIRWILLPICVVATWMAVTWVAAWLYSWFPSSDHDAQAALGLIGLGWLTSLAPVYFVARFISPAWKRGSAITATLIIGAPILIPMIIGLIQGLIPELIREWPW
jgi:hypothetical protein